MKNLYLFNYLSKAAFYGIGTYTEQLVQCMRRENIRIYIVDMFSAEMEFMRKEINGIEHIVMPRIRQHVTEDEYCVNMLYILRQYVDNKAENIFHLNYLNNYSLVKGLKKYFRAKIIITVHYCEPMFLLNGNYDLFKSIVFSRKKKTDSPLYDLVRKQWKEVKKILSCADSVIAIAQHSFNMIMEMYEVDRSKMVLIQNGIKDLYTNISLLERNEIRKEFGINKREKIILFAGRLDKVKGADILIKAFLLLKKKYDNLHLIIAGGGDMSVLFPLILPQLTSVSFTGFINSATLAKLYKIADMGVVPSVYEEFGYVTIEMMMYGLPVIAFNTSSPSEQITHGEDGLLAIVDCDLDDIEKMSTSLAKEMEYFLVNSSLFTSMKKKCRSNFLKKYDLEIFRQNMKEVYSLL